MTRSKHNVASSAVRAVAGIVLAIALPACNDRGGAEHDTPTNPQARTLTLERDLAAKDGAFAGEKGRRLDRVMIRSDHWRSTSIQIIGNHPLDGTPKQLLLRPLRSADHNRATQVDMAAAGIWSLLGVATRMYNRGSSG